MFIARKSYLRITRGIVFSAQRLTCEIRSPTKRTHWFNTKVHTLHSCTNHDSSSCKRCNKYETRMTFSTTRGRSWPWSITILLKKPFHMLALLTDRLCTVQRRKCPKHGAEHQQVSSIFLYFYSITSWPLMPGYTHRPIWTELRGEKGKLYSSWSLSLSPAFYEAMADNLWLQWDRFSRASATVQHVLNGTGCVPPASNWRLLDCKPPGIHPVLCL